MKFLYILILLLVVFSSCDSKYVFEDYKTINHEGWDRDSAIVFNMPVRNIDHSYKMYVNVRNMGNYSKRNLWLYVNIIYPDGRLLSDTVDFYLADEFGIWEGKGIGDLYDNQFFYKKNILFPVIGEYSVSLRQIMKKKNLRGILDVGIQLESEKLNVRD
ncbi:MAG: gliding motility lipoprotein GldH [Prolixibacteraceae bacterium]|nr:gliding motility lipoprotein GldH [Prolixibacteraceae bacterium]